MTKKDIQVSLFKKTVLLASKILYCKCKNKSENRQSLEILKFRFDKENQAHPCCTVIQFHCCHRFLDIKAAGSACRL